MARNLVVDAMLLKDVKRAFDIDEPCSLFRQVSSAIIFRRIHHSKTRIGTGSKHVRQDLPWHLEGHEAAAKHTVTCNARTW
jgi:hypothetical protein